LLVLANRIARANIIAPLINSYLIHAAILGWIAFGDWPDMISFIGLSIILLAGASSLWLARAGR